MNPKSRNPSPALPISTHHHQQHPRKKPSACVRCRQRKVKCDKEHPQCKCCTKRGMTCEYIDPKKTGPKSSGNTTKKIEKQRPTPSKMKVILPATQLSTSLLKRRSHSTKNGSIVNSIHSLPIESFEKNPKTHTDTGLSNTIKEVTATAKSHISPSIQNIISPLPVSKKSSISTISETTTFESPGESCKSLSLNLPPATFDFTYSEASLSERLKMMKLDQSGLTVNDIDVLHNYWFNW
ncbi:unnamed protein product [Ambrosiozyma monospora]|uniref:Unnamed protein product n=1 Tax=Ambrosiozyma monospora TaxID=43982 RepID=A0ACB5SXS9_AMBMO|nr:unnamed protein product [Ambrosiozyma monospora]